MILLKGLGSQGADFVPYLEYSIQMTPPLRAGPVENTFGGPSTVLLASPLVGVGSESPARRIGRSRVSFPASPISKCMLG
jgi:hypothetical protein